MDITDENSEEGRTSFKKITQEDDEKESLYWGWRGKTGGVQSGAAAVVSNQPQTWQMEWASFHQGPPFCRVEKDREGKKCPVIIKHFIFLYFCDLQW